MRPLLGQPVRAGNFSRGRKRLAFPSSTALECLLAGDRKTWRGLARCGLFSENHWENLRKGCRRDVARYAFLAPAKTLQATSLRTSRYWPAAFSNSAFKCTLLPVLTLSVRSQSLNPVFLTVTVWYPSGN